MAYVQIQNLVDTDRRYVVKAVNEGTSENAALLINVAALAYNMQTLTTDLAANSFKVGESVNSSSGGSAVVQDVTNSTSVVLIDVVGTFSDNDIITGAESNKARTQSGSLVSVAKVVNITRIIYNVGGDLSTKIRLEWEGTGGGANNRTIATLSGSGILELDTYGMRANNTANSATGNVLISTLLGGSTTWNANCHYTLYLDTSKTAGYAPPYYDRNTQGGY